MREASWSFVSVAKWGFRSGVARHHSVFTRPPPPRLVVLLLPPAHPHPSHTYFEPLDHALVVRDTHPSAIERRAMVHGDAEERKPNGDVDAGEPHPPLRRLVVVEAEGLHGDVPLVVIHGDDDIK